MKLQPKQLREYKDLVYKQGKVALTAIELIHIPELIESMKSDLGDLTIMIISFIDSNPNYHYPEPKSLFERNDYRFAYWANGINYSEYFRIQKAIMVLASHYNYSGKTKIEIASIFDKTEYECGTIFDENHIKNYYPAIAKNFYEVTLPKSFSYLNRFLNELSIRQKKDLYNEYLGYYIEFEKAFQKLNQKAPNQPYSTAVKLYELAFLKNLGAAMLQELNHEENTAKKVGRPPKEDLTPLQFFRNDQTRIDELKDQLKKLGYLNANEEWTGKPQQLETLHFYLKENNYVKSCNASEVRRIYFALFNFKIHEKAFRPERPINNESLEEFKKNLKI